MTTQASAAAGWRKMAMQAIAGAIAGAVGMLAVTSLMERQAGLDWAPSQIILVGIGFIYMLMGCLSASALWRRACSAKGC